MQPGERERLGEVGQPGGLVRRLPGVDLDDHVTAEAPRRKQLEQLAARLAAPARAPDARPSPTRSRRSCARGGAARRAHGHLNGVAAATWPSATGRASCGRSPARRGSSPAGRPGARAATLARGTCSRRRTRRRSRASSSAIPSTKPARSRAASETADARRPCRHRARAPSLRCARSFAPGLGPPHPLDDQQARRVDGADGHFVLRRPAADRVDVLAGRVDADHDLDGVVARARLPTRTRWQSTPGRPRRSTAPTRADGTRTAGAAAVGFGWAPVIRRTSESSDCRITPSRSAHGQISSDSMPKMSITASATTPPATSWWARPGDTPAAGRARPGSAAPASAAAWQGATAGQRPPDERPVGGRWGAADPGQRAERLRGGDRVVLGPGAQHGARHLARSVPGRTCAGRGSRTRAGRRRGATRG